MATSKQNFAEISSQFFAKMAEFEKRLDSAAQTQSIHTIGEIAEEFSSFKLFMINSLRSLQQQLDELAKQLDRVEMRSRRKMLLVHGIPEAKDEDTSRSILKLFADHINTTEVTANLLSKSHRMGVFNSNRTRPIVVKFKDVALRDKVWYAKAVFKGSGVTLSEFLTACRHDTLLQARKRFGVTKCWSKEGVIIVLAPDGSRHRAYCTADLDAISGLESTATVSVSGATSIAQRKEGKDTSSQRSKRTKQK